MSAILTLTIVAAIAGTMVFASGYIRGVLKAIDEYGTPAVQIEDTGGNYWLTVAIAIVGAGVAVTLLGVTPVWMLIIPFLSILSATLVGVAFFVE